MLFHCLNEITLKCTLRDIYLILWLVLILCFYPCPRDKPQRSRYSFIYVTIQVGVLLHYSYI